MPLEVADEGLGKTPNLEITQWKYMLTTPEQKDSVEIKDKLMSCIQNDKSLQKENSEEVTRLEAKIKDAEENQGELEIRDAIMVLAEHYCRIGNKDECLTTLRRQEGNKSVTLGYKLDMTFLQIRLGLFFQDTDLVTRMLDKAQGLMEEGGDWDRRNRLKVYQGVFAMSVQRDFATAATHFLDTLATFTSYELMPYRQFVVYAVLCAAYALERTQLRDKMIKGAEVLEQLHSMPETRDYLFSLYECRYADFFKALAWIEQEHLKFDWLLHTHCRHYVREMRLKAYAQILQSYQSLSLAYMANAFGVTPAYIDADVARFIAAGRLAAKIDKVNDVVETNRPDSKNHQYQQTIKHGDVLLNRIQKLSRIINL